MPLTGSGRAVSGSRGGGPLFETLRDLLNSGELERFHATPGMKTQTIAEHSWRVSMVAFKLWGIQSAEEIMRYLTHDCGELASGDIPAPTKWGHPRLSKLTNEIERLERVRLGVEMPETRDPGVHRRLKLADGIELMITCLRERKQGNQYADPVFLAISEHVVEEFYLSNGELELVQSVVMAYLVAGYPQAESMNSVLEKINEIVEGRRAEQAAD